jgi:hypothetical protein
MLLLVACAANNHSSTHKEPLINLEKEVKITDAALFFDGKRIDCVQEAFQPKDNSEDQYDYKFGPIFNFFCNTRKYRSPIQSMRQNDYY